MRLTPIDIAPLAPDEVAITEDEILADLLYPTPPASAGGAAIAKS